MIIQNSDPLKEIIRYQEQLKSTSQRIELLILENQASEMQSLKDLILEEQQLIKYLEIQSTRLNPHSKQIYMRNMVRFKRKAKEHKDYIAVTHGKSALPPKSQNAAFLDLQKQNDHLVSNKMVMYDNKMAQDRVGGDLHDQGEKLYGGIERNREIRRDVDEAEDSIGLIKVAILKRKMMFSSLIVFFVIALIIAMVVKSNKK